MDDVFENSLEWSAVDIELTEQLIASADKRTLAQNPSVKGANQTTAQPVTPPERVTRSSSRLSALAARKAGSADCSTGTAKSNADGEPQKSASKGHQDTSADRVTADRVTADVAAPDSGHITEARQLVPIPDLEDIGLQQDRRHLRPHGFSVTDFTASQWCQQQFALALSAHLPEEATETAAMASGKELHRVLEAEVKEEVDVELATAEDAWALRLLSCIQCFCQLRKRGMTREVYLFGQLQGVWVKGIVDELRLDDLGKIVIVEVKTRRSNSFPSDAQKRTAELQAMVYRTLLSGLAEACSPCSASGLYTMHMLEPKRDLSKQVREFSREQGIALVTNLAQVTDCLRETAANLPPCSEEMEVRYMYQADRSVIGSMPVWHDQTLLQQQLSTQFSMLLGRAPPEKVPICEDWKCAYCIFYHACGGPMKESTEHEISKRNDVQEKGYLAACYGNAAQ